MKKGFILTKTITIHREPAAVWAALTDPEKVKQYFFGTQLTSDWKIGGPITYTGSWEGTPYEDKGTVLKFEKEKVMQHDYWSSFSGKADAPENYQVITYRLKPKNTGTLLTITQNNIESLEQKKHSADNWGMVIGGMKKMLEEGTI